MKKLLLVLFFVFVQGIAGAAELTIQGGANHTSNSNYGDGARLAVRVENPLNDYLSLGAEYGFHGNMNHYAENGESYGDLSGHSLFGEVILYPLKTRLKPYLLAGAGWGFWSWDRSASMREKDIFIEVGDAFAYKFALGANKEIKKNWSIGVEWGYFNTDIPKKAHYGDGSFSNVLDTGPTIGEPETYIVGQIRAKF